MPPKKTQQAGLVDAWGRRNRRLPDLVCAECGKVFRPAKATAKYCSKTCRWRNNGGHNKKPESWWLGSKGYVTGRVWVDGQRRNVRQHCYVMEQSIGRRLLLHETVHHVNGNKQDNRIENLQLLTKTEHDKLHQSRRVYRRGYKLDLTDEERAARSQRMRDMRAAQRD